MKLKIILFALMMTGLVAQAKQVVKIGKEELKDKIKGGWVGQMAGCAWGGPTEFIYNNVMMKDSEIPVWQSQEINKVFSNLGDDVYVEIPFMEAMKTFGPNCNWHQMGEVFAATKFELWHANFNGRENLKKGLKPPYSGHYLHNFSPFTGKGHSEHDDIDFQIESDFAGIVAPGMPNVASDIAWRAGHVMNWGNGVYAGVMVAAMHSAAYTANSVSEIIEAGRLSVPVGTRYREMMDDVIRWKAEGKSFAENWKLVTDKYKRTNVAGKGDPKDDLKASDCDFIDTTQNGAYILLGMLYGNGDFELSMKLAMQCGGDSDCTPSSIGGILGNFIGFNAIPEKWKPSLDYTKVFPFTNYTLNNCIDLSFVIAMQIMEMTGISVKNAGKPNEYYQFEKTSVMPVAFEQCIYTKNEMGLTDSRLVVKNDGPQLKAAAGSPKGKKIDFKAEASDSDGIKEYFWFFGDLTWQSGQNPTHSYKKPGTYHVVCYVSDSFGYTSFQELSVVIAK